METTPSDQAVVASWPDYQKHRVGVQFPGAPEKLITPEKARELADAIEDNCIDDLMDPNLETRQFVNDLRAHADDVEPDE